MLYHLPMPEHAQKIKDVYLFDVAYRAGDTVQGHDDAAEAYR